MYLGFSSDELDQNQITDYLTRVVQPKLSAVSGVQRADILGSRVFAMRIWLKPERMAALGISPTNVRDALADNNYLSALGKTKGSMVSVNLVANTNLQTADEFRKLVVKQKDGVVVRLGEIADVVLGAENLRRRRPLQRPDRHVHGNLGPADRQLARRDQARPRQPCPRSRRSCRRA